MIRNDARRYGLVAQTLHWLVAALIIFTIGLGYYMEDLPDSLAKLELYNLHKSIGITILTLVLLRLIWRAFNPAPPLPASMANWERYAAHASHALLYGLMIVQPVVGFLHSNAADFPVVVWDVLPLPAVIGKDEALAETLVGVHGFLGTSLAVLVLIHAAAALRHHFWLGDDVLRRMLPGTQVRG